MSNLIVSNKQSPKNYIYFKGGSWGDITGAIVNNNTYIDHELQKLLKKSSRIIDKKLLSNLDIETLVGHNRSVLNHGYKNFTIIITDKKIRDIAAQRFADTNYFSEISDVLGYYYPKELLDKIKELPLSKQVELLTKKYDIDTDIDATEIDLSCSFDKEKYIGMLFKIFTFDKKLASKTYDTWYQKQTYLP